MLFRSACIIAMVPVCTDLNQGVSLIGIGIEENCLMFDSKCMLLHEEAIIAMNYPALNVAADYLARARATPKLEYIYIAAIRSESRDKKNKVSTLKPIDWYLSDRLLIKFNIVL